MMEEMATRLARMEETQKHMSEKLNEVDAKLFGNGRPGVIEVQNSRIGVIEGQIKVVIGVCSAIGAMWAIVTFVLVYIKK